MRRRRVTAVFSFAIQRNAWIKYCSGGVNWGNSRRGYLRRRAFEGQVEANVWGFLWFNKRELGACCWLSVYQCLAMRCRQT